MKAEHHPETLRVDRDIALREAATAFDRGDYDAEVMHYEKARQIQQDIYRAETRYERRAEVDMVSPPPLLSVDIDTLSIRRI